MLDVNAIPLACELGLGFTLLEWQHQQTIITSSVPYQSFIKIKSYEHGLLELLIRISFTLIDCFTTSKWYISVFDHVLKREITELLKSLCRACSMPFCSSTPELRMCNYDHSDYL